VLNQERLHRAYDTVRERLIAEMTPEGYWQGELSSSALSTATAVSALICIDRQAHQGLIESGVRWLTDYQNSDGGWGDTTDSPSNISTTFLGISALTLHGGAEDCLGRARAYLETQAGKTPDEWIATLHRIYGDDRTFAVPILTHAAIAGLVPWDVVPSLPFELAALPHGLYRFLRLQVVSYALPALIAVGLTVHRRKPRRNAFTSTLRAAITPLALRKLRSIQPSSGGFLEATPLNSFVTMSLAAAGLGDHPVARDCVRFIVASARSDGSWPIDSDLSVWLTTQAVLALESGGHLADIDAAKTQAWLLRQQYKNIHPYTHSAPGGWAWTHRPGGVPDADDTARAITALARLGATEHLTSGGHWLLSIQNSDGGWPTFCRGWGRLPFDRSSPDITAHAIQALAAMPPTTRLDAVIRRGRRYLESSQRDDGSWFPLWFGNQTVAGRHNPVFGTAQVLPALGASPAMQRAVAFLIGAQNSDGGWGGAAGVASSVEETAVAVSALSGASEVADARPAASRGLDYLVGRVEAGTWDRPAPIGLYFAKLWYSERLYPIIWIAEALGQAVNTIRTKDADG
jgi:squalene-hopene/tetraprenyl-beta-curcumene cyclase